MLVDEILLQVGDRLLEYRCALFGLGVEGGVDDLELAHVALHAYVG